MTTTTRRRRRLSPADLGPLHLLALGCLLALALIALDREGRGANVARCGTDSECAALPECAADPACDGGPVPVQR